MTAVRFIVTAYTCIIMSAFFTAAAGTLQYENYSYHEGFENAFP
jgi:hypothetical protein